MSDKLPSGWARAPLAGISLINPRHPKHLDNTLHVTFTPMAALSDSRPDFEYTEERLLGQVRTGFTHFAEGDVLFAKITPCMENGKGAVARNLRNELGCGTTELHVVRPLADISPEYIYRFLAQDRVRRTAKENFTGTAGQARVPTSFIEELEVPLPPLTEQIRIVAKLETLLGKVDACQKRLAKIPLLLKRFRQSVLAAACSGRLTVDWREENAAENHFGESFQVPDEWPTLPRNWRWRRLELVCERIVDCPHSTPKWADSGRLCVRTTNFKPGFLDLSEVRYVSEATFNERIERLRPEAGDILYSREGGILGVACMIPPKVQLCLGQRIMLFRTKLDFASAFLMHWLNSPVIVRHVRDLTGGSAAPHLNVGDIKGFPIPVPTFPEQQEVVRRVEQLFALASEIEARYAKAKAHVDKLTQSILAKAFRGELVPQDPNDEPADKLLERIRQEKAQTTIPVRSKRKTSP